jgi:hypothetical protein
VLSDNTADWGPLDNHSYDLLRKFYTL